MICRRILYGVPYSYPATEQGISLYYISIVCSVVIVYSVSWNQTLTKERWLIIGAAILGGLCNSYAMIPLLSNIFFEKVSFPELYLQLMTIHSHAKETRRFQTGENKATIEAKLVGMLQSKRVLFGGHLSFNIFILVLSTKFLNYGGKSVGVEALL